MYVCFCLRRMTLKQGKVLIFIQRKFIEIILIMQFSLKLSAEDMKDYMIGIMIESRMNFILLARMTDF